MYIGIKLKNLSTKSKISFIIFAFLSISLLFYYRKILQKGHNFGIVLDNQFNPCDNKDYLNSNLYHQLIRNEDRMFNLSTIYKMPHDFRPKGTNVSIMSDAFTPQMTRQVYSRIEDLLEIWIEVIKQIDDHGNCYMMSGGTLLGSYRHHGLVPWDDDLDLNCHIECVPAIRKALDKYKPHILYSSGSQKMKVYATIDSSSSFHTSPYSWNWPYLDISFYNTNATHFREIPKTYGRFYHYKKEEILPFVMRPFGRFWMPAPKNSLYYIIETYGKEAIEMCVDGGYSHILEGGRKQNILNCDDLKTTYPFVYRKQLANELSPKESSDNLIWIKETLGILRENITKHILILHTICLPDISNN